MRLILYLVEVILYYKNSAVLDTFALTMNIFNPVVIIEYSITPKRLNYVSLININQINQKNLWNMKHGSN